jgi:hypothetical protein
MAGCQAVKQNGTHCRSYARKGLTCCRVHDYLENVVAEIEPPTNPVCEEDLWNELNKVFLECLDQKVADGKW